MPNDDENPVLPPTEDLNLGGEDDDNPSDDNPQPQVDDDEDENPNPTPPADPEPSDEDEEPAPPSPRESKRIKSLLEKLGSQQQPTFTPPRVTTQPQQPQGNDPIIPEGDYTLEEINQRAKEYATKTADQRYQEGLAQAQQLATQQANVLAFYTDLKLEAPRVNSRYDFMNRESPNYDQARQELVDGMYLRTVGYSQGDPQRGIPASVQRNDISYEDFVDGIMELVGTQAAMEQVESQKQVNKQAAQQGVRPNGSGRKSRSSDNPREMTDDELDAAIAENLSILPGARKGR